MISVKCTLWHPDPDWILKILTKGLSVWLSLSILLCIYSGTRARSNQWDKSQSIRHGRLNGEYTPCWIQTRVSKPVVFMAYGTSYRVNTNQEGPSIIMRITPQSGILSMQQESENLIMVNVQNCILQWWTSHQPRYFTFYGCFSRQHKRSLNKLKLPYYKQYGMRWNAL